MSEARDLSELLAQLKAAYLAVDAKIRSNVEGYAAFMEAGELGATTDALDRAAATLRGEMARRVAQEERLRLRGLAQRLSMSPTRAAQLVKRGNVDGTDDSET